MGVVGGQDWEWGWLAGGMPRHPHCVRNHFRGETYRVAWFLDAEVVSRVAAVAVVVAVVAAVVAAAAVAAAGLRGL